MGGEVKFFLYQKQGGNAEGEGGGPQQVLGWFNNKTYCKKICLLNSS